MHMLVTFSAVTSHTLRLEVRCFGFGGADRDADACRRFGACHVQLHEPHAVVIHDEAFVDALTGRLRSRGDYTPPTSLYHLCDASSPPRQLRRAEAALLATCGTVASCSRACWRLWVSVMLQGRHSREEHRGIHTWYCHRSYRMDIKLESPRKIWERGHL